MIDRPSAKEWLVRIFERGNRSYPSDKEPYQTGPNWFRCADGAKFSVIAGYGTYSSPRPGWPEEWGGAPDDYTGPYIAVEVWFPGADEPEAEVPAERLWEYVKEHGGVVDYLDPGIPPSDNPDWSTE